MTRRCCWRSEHGDGSAGVVREWEIHRVHVGRISWQPVREYLARGFRRHDPKQITDEHDFRAPVWRVRPMGSGTVYFRDWFSQEIKRASGLTVEKRRWWRARRSPMRSLTIRRIWRFRPTASGSRFSIHVEPEGNENRRIRRKSCQGIWAQAAQVRMPARVELHQTRTAGAGDAKNKSTGAAAGRVRCARQERRWRECGKGAGAGDENAANPVTRIIKPD